ncbi:SirB2 family protein [Elongatibacter sediminis]|uniref:SirB2 family protein n=1 Tax=Elongatibacter sediminis TaxID=3119006 RepID=A0AAW9RB92_9GAMM
MTYPELKLLHVALALTSIAGFTLRWTWKRIGHAWYEARVTRILPHIIDTGLLAAGILLAIRIAQYPLTHSWLTAKIAGLIAYILIGAVAMRAAPRSHLSMAAFTLAVLVFAWMASVARTKSVWGFIAPLLA